MSKRRFDHYSSAVPAAPVAAVFLKPAIPKTKPLLTFSTGKGTSCTRAAVSWVEFQFSAGEVAFVKSTRLISPPGTYFVTFSTWQRRRLFVVENYARLLLGTMYAYRQQGKFHLHAFVLMPEHVHLLLTPAADITIEKVVQLIKGVYSHAFGAEFGKHNEVWQRGFTDHRIRDRGDFETHRKYIHDNPVKRWLVLIAADYRYCSAYPGFKLDELTSVAEAAIALPQPARVELVPFPWIAPGKETSSADERRSGPHPCHTA